MNEIYDGTRVIHGECRLEATSPWGDDVALNGLRLHLDLRILPRGSRMARGDRASTALQRTAASLWALCFGSDRHGWRRALVAVMGALALAGAFWVRVPSGSRAPSSDGASAPVADKAPAPSPLPSPAVRLPMPPPAMVAPVPLELVPPPAVSPPPDLASPPLVRAPAPKEQASARRAVAPAEPAPTPPTNTPARAVKSFSSLPASDRASVPTPPAVPIRQANDMLDLFGDTK